MPRDKTTTPVDETVAGKAISTVTDYITGELELAWEARDLDRVRQWQAANNSWATTMQSMHKALDKTPGR